MTNEEFIAQNLCNDCNDKATCSVSCYWFDHMKRLAEWKDEQFAAEKQALIDKACEWLKGNVSRYLASYGPESSDVCIEKASLIKNFRKTMEVRK